MNICRGGGGEGGGGVGGGGGGGGWGGGRGAHRPSSAQPPPSSPTSHPLGPSLPPSTKAFLLIFSTTTPPNVWPMFDYHSTQCFKWASLWNSLHGIPTLKVGIFGFKLREHVWVTHVPWKLDVLNAIFEQYRNSWQYFDLLLRLLRWQQGLDMFEMRTVLLESSQVPQPACDQMIWGTWLAWKQTLDKYFYRTELEVQKLSTSASIVPSLIFKDSADMQPWIKFPKLLEEAV